MQWIALALMPAVLLAGCSVPQDGLDELADGQSAGGAHYAVFAMNRRGMSFPDNDFTVSAIFPPANFLVAQVVKISTDPAVMPELLDDTQVEVRYSAVADSTGSINTVSSTKTNFWSNADEL